jgi:hypothetical protein
MDRKITILGVLVFLLFCFSLIAQNKPIYNCQFIKRSDESVLVKIYEQGNENKNIEPIIGQVLLIKTGVISEIKFLKTTVNERDFFTHFSTGILSIPKHSEIDLPNEGLKPIKAGNYKIEETDLHYIIKLE